MNSVDPLRSDLAAEFKKTPLGPHGDELQKVLNILRWAEVDGKKTLVKRGNQWHLAALNTAWCTPIQIDDSIRFDSLEDGFWYLFRHRWKAHTGEFPTVD